MGGHSAWRKRIAAGLNAKGMGGAICRHRPHFGRKGKDLVKNRKGNIGGGNPKKRKKRRDGTDAEDVNDEPFSLKHHGARHQGGKLLIGLMITISFVPILAYIRRQMSMTNFAEAEVSLRP